MLQQGVGRKLIKTPLDFLSGAFITIYFIIRFVYLFKEILDILTTICLILG